MTVAKEVIKRCREEESLVMRENAETEEELVDEVPICMTAEETW